MAKGRSGKRQRAHQAMGLPRSIDPDDVTGEDIQDIALTINTTPRKCTGFKSPVEAFLNELGKHVDIRFNANVALRSCIYPRRIGRGKSGAYIPSD